MLIREYRESDLADMISIWNDIVEEGISFPYEETLDQSGGAEFSADKAIAVSPKKMEGLLACIPFIPII